MGRLDGKVALITGGSRGQGRAIAMKLASDGADVVITDVGRDIAGLEYSMATDVEAQETIGLVEEAGRRCLALVADVRDHTALDEAAATSIETFGQLDILVANAGIIDLKPFWEITEDEWATIVDVNLTGAWRSAKAVASHMRERFSGSIVFNCSLNGIEGAWNYAHYVAAKHGVLGLMKGVALELAPYGVRVNATLPTIIVTPFNDHPAMWARVAGRKDATRDECIDSMRSFHALRGRSGLPPSAVADAIAWLVSDEARHITGVELPVDAGHLLLPGSNPRPIPGEGPEHDTPDPWPVDPA